MSLNFLQYGDGTAAFVNMADAVKDVVLGGPATPSVASPRFYAVRVMKMPLTAGVDTGGGVLSWQNNTGQDILVDGLILDVTTVANAACSLSAGTTAVGATTSSANLIDTLDVRSATGTFDNITDKGSNGKSRQKIASGKWLTISTASGASAGLVGNAYLFFVPV